MSGQAPKGAGISKKIFKKAHKTQKKEGGKTGKDAVKKAVCLYKMVKQMYPDTSVTSKIRSVTNYFARNNVERTEGEEASDDENPTITSREIQRALHLLLPGQLTRHAVSESPKAVKYTSSK